MTHALIMLALLSQSARHDLILVPMGNEIGATTTYLMELCRWASHEPEIAGRLGTIYVVTDVTSEFNKEVRSLVVDQPRAGSEGTEDLKQMAKRLQDQSLEIREQRLRLPACYRGPSAEEPDEITVVFVDKVHLGEVTGDALRFQRISSAGSLPPKPGYVPLLKHTIPEVVKLLAATILDGIGVPVAGIRSSVRSPDGPECDRRAQSADLCIAETASAELTLVAVNSPYRAANQVDISQKPDWRILRMPEGNGGRQRRGDPPT